MPLPCGANSSVGTLDAQNGNFIGKSNLNSYKIAIH